MPTRPSYHRPQHAPTIKRTRPSTFALGYDKAWERARKQHLTEYPYCVFCSEFASHVDHRVPVAVDPSRRLDPTNWRSCCASCHSLLTNNFRRTGVNEMPPSRTAGGAGR